MSDPQNDQNEMEQTQELQGSVDTQQVDFVTMLDFLRTRFYFHELIDSSNISNHYIVEDIEVDPMELNDPDAPLLYYLKQMKFDSQEEFQNAKQFYGKIFNYCKTPFAKNDIAKIEYVYEFGESDRIDIENIEIVHINKFLKNMCILLNDLMKFDSIYHSNITLKNIVLVHNELKLSGYKPLFIDSDKKNWKHDFTKEFGFHRLDIFMLAHLWLRFLNFKKIGEINDQMTLEEVMKVVRAVKAEIPSETHFEIVSKMLDITNRPSLTLDDIILDFDEYFILEKNSTK